jgi:hypothetical protein
MARRRPGRLSDKRSDRRFVDSEGHVWASKFEARIYEALRSNGVDVQRCGEGDSFNYVQPISGGGRCLSCGGDKCVQERIYTPDLRIHLGSERGNRYIETKGYFPQQKRALFRHFRKSNPDVDIRVVLERDLKVGKGHLTDYFARYLKDVPVLVYRGDDEELRRFILE